MEEENNEARIELNNLRENLNTLIQNTASNFNQKISALKRELEEKAEREKTAKEKAEKEKTAKDKAEKDRMASNSSRYPEKSTDRQLKRPVILDFMVLKDIIVKGKPLSKRAKSRSRSSNVSDKENDRSHSSKRARHQGEVLDFGANYPSNKHGGKDYVSGALSEKSNHVNTPQDRQHPSHRSIKTEGVEKVRNLEGVVAGLRKQIKDRDEEVKQLNRIILQQHDELKALEEEYSRQPRSAEKVNMSDENIGDLSIDTEDLNTAEPSKLLRIIRSLRQEEHLLNQRLIVLREEIEKMDKEKAGLVEEFDQIKKETKKSQKNNKKIEKSEDEENDEMQDQESIKATPKKKNVVYKDKEREAVQSDGDEDFSNYFILKKKFDEIHAFVTRIAGLLSKSVQQSRRRHATPELKDAYLKTDSQKIEGIKLWLHCSPSKSQIDKDSKRFYLKFKKRFDSSKIF